MQPLDRPDCRLSTPPSEQSWLTSERGRGKMGDGPGTPTTNP